MTNDAGSGEVVSVRGLRKAYGGRAVVDDLDLEVRRGEVLGLIGANGAGKTTTVECLQGLRRPDAGRVRVLGLDPVRDADRLRPRIGSQLQDSGLPDRLRVHEAIRLFAAGPGTRGDELLEQFGLAPRRSSAFSSLSGGERQRLFLVLALLNRPELVILDELTQGLDPAARRDVWSAVATLRDGGTTVLLVTHELVEAEVLCGRVVAMRSGRVLDSGTPAELIARHAGGATVRFTDREPLAGADRAGNAATGAVAAAGTDQARAGEAAVGGDAASGAQAVAQLLRLPGVRDVTRDVGAGGGGGGAVGGDRFTVRGERQVIAQVGAWLVRRGPVPSDLRVEVPDLESALLALLDGDRPQPVTDRTSPAAAPAGRGGPNRPAGPTPTTLIGAHR